MTVRIIIEYRLVGSQNWEANELTPESYFDLDEGENAETDSVPRFANPLEYLPLDPQGICATRVCITDDLKNRSRTFRSFIWNSGKNQIVERKDKDISGEEWELILNISIGERPPKWEILRVGKEGDDLHILSHVFIERCLDGSEFETLIHPEE